MSTFASRLRAERVRAGLSQTELAGADMSPSYISLMEAGRRSPTAEVLARLAERLGTSADYLRHGDQGAEREQGRLQVALAQAEVSRGLLREASDRLANVDLDSIGERYRSRALLTLARVREGMGDLSEAVTLYETLLGEALRAGRHLDAAAIAADLVGAYHEAGNLGRAITLGEGVLAELEVAALAGTSEHLRLAATTLWSYYERGDLLYATQRAAELVGVAERAPTSRDRARLYLEAAGLAERQGHLLGARDLAERAAAAAATDVVADDTPRARLQYAWLLLRAVRSRPDVALEQLDLAADALVNVGSPSVRARLGTERARAHLLLGSHECARALAQEALAVLGDLDAGIDVCEARIVLGDVCAAAGDLDDASRHYQWAADRLERLASGRTTAGVWSALADRLSAQGDHVRASHAYRAAVRAAGVRVRPATPASAGATQQ